MSKRTKLVRDDEYEELGSAYQCVLIAALDEALRKNGMTAASKRKKVCRDFMISIGNLHDQGWFKPGSKPIFPIVCFSKTFLNIDTNIDKLGTLYAPSSMFSYYEYAFSCVDAYFDNDPAGRIEVGCFADLS